MARPVRSTPSDEIGSRLAAGLKSARQMRGLSLDAVAKLSGVSRSMVSQIERGESSPTVSTLWNLTRALQVDFAGLLEGHVASTIEVVRAEDAPVIAGRGEDVTFRILSAPEMAGEHEIYEITFGPGAELVSDPHRAGCREHIILRQGAVTVALGEDRAELSPGDSASYAADRPHALIAGEAGAEVLMIVRNS